jgi:hypothetical protein
MSPENPSLEKVYPLPPFVLACSLANPFLALVITGMGLLTFSPYLNFSVAYSVGATFAGMATFAMTTAMYRATKHVRLVLTDDGITYYGRGFSIYTPWQNVIGVGSVQPFPFPLNFLKVPGLRLRHPSVLGMKLIEGRQQGIAVLETARRNPTLIKALFASNLPIRPWVLYTRNWKESELCRDLQHYAP